MNVCGHVCGRIPGKPAAGQCGAGEDRLDITELGLAQVAIQRAVYNTLSYIYLCAFLGDSTDLLENSFFVNITKMQPYVSHD